MSTTPLPVVMIPELWSALFGRTATFPQTSIESADCQWSVSSGGVVFGVVVVVVVVFAAACSRSWRLKTIRARPIRQTASTIEYHP
jgi:hypothetical protein